jgi:chloramphenicol 3-O-phosphotransferase
VPDHPLILLTGTSAAGKTTVGRLLADALPTSAFVEGDAVRTMIRNGRADMAPEPSPEALRQLELRYRQTALLADSFHEAGFATVVEDVIIGRHLVEFVRSLRARPLHVVVLVPDEETVRRREAERSKIAYDDVWTPAALNAVVHRDTPRIGLWLDSSTQTAEQTVEQVLNRLPESLIEHL